MNRKPITTLIILALLLTTLASCQLTPAERVVECQTVIVDVQVEPCPPCDDCDCDAPPSRAADTTTFTNIAAADLALSDDLTVADDATITDDLAVSGDLKVGDGTPDVTQNGEDAYVEGTFEVDGASEFDGALNVDGAADFDSTVDIAGNVSDGAGTFTVADDVLVDGAADAIQLTVQGYTTQTTNAGLFVVEDSGGTDIFSVSVPPAAGSGGDLVDLTDTFAIANGSDAMIGIDVNLTGANHTGSGNTLVGIDLDLTTADADATESAISIADTDWDYGIESVLNLENLLIPSVHSSAITYQSTGALWTVGATEVWYIHRVFCNITTNFDCGGDNDCTLDIGDGDDQDGFLDLDDAELQSTDAEISGLPAGWQGFGSTDTRGAYLAAGGGVIEANDTIDITIAGTGLDAGAGTCYIVYTRLQ